MQNESRSAATCEAALCAPWLDILKALSGEKSAPSTLQSRRHADIGGQCSPEIRISVSSRADISQGGRHCPAGLDAGRTLSYVPLELGQLAIGFCC